MMKMSFSAILLLIFSTTLFAQEDPLYPDAWHLENTGQNSYATNGGTPGFDIKAKPVIESGIKGEGVKIAVSDTGIDVGHEDLNLNFSLPGSRDFLISETEDNQPLYKGDSSADAHGTSVTGIIAAVGENNLGSMGVAPNAEFGGFNYLAPGVNAGVWPYQMEGPFDIFNYSYGMRTCFVINGSSSLINAYKNGVTNLRDGKGAVYVKAAGNDFSSSSTYCTSDPNWSLEFYGNSIFDEGQNYPYTLMVGAMNADGFKSSYSTPGANIWVTAPGGEYGTNKPAIMAPDLTGCYMGRSWLGASGEFDSGALPENFNCNYTSTMNGTSSATPNVSGVIALMLSANPDLTWRDVKHILATYSTIIDPDSGPYNHPGGRDLAGHTYRDGWVVNAAEYSFHTYYGFGLVNAEAAVKAAQNYNTDLGLLESARFDSGSFKILIPNNSATGTENSIISIKDYQLEAVQVEVSLSHEYVENIGIELTSPSGTKSIIVNINSANISKEFRNFTFLTNAFYGERSLGKWTLKVIDGSDVNADGTSGTEGVLTNWKINLIGHMPLTPLKSHQILPKNIVISKNRKVKKHQRRGKLYSIERKERNRHPADPFLIESTKEFWWSHNIYAIRDKDYSGPPYNILGTLFKLNVILSEVKPPKGYYVIKSRRTKKLGIYTGHIYAFGKDAEIEDFLSRRKAKWDKVAGVYIIKIESLLGGYNLRNDLRFKSPSSTVDLGLHYALDIPL